MIHIRPAAERGHADHGWLDAWHTFSFADYRDPDFMGFSVLRVLNQDRVQPGQGFATHAHHDMEIVTYVLDGVLRHRDSMGHGSTIRPGEVQLMSAGTGVTHSEFNGSDTDVLELLQMWILPARRGTEPRYEQKTFDEELDGTLRLVASPDGSDGSLTIGQGVRLYAARLAAGTHTRSVLGPGRCAWLHLARGKAALNGRSLGSGDGVAIQDETRLELVAAQDSNLVLWDLPAT